MIILNFRDDLPSFMTNQREEGRQLLKKPLRTSFRRIPLWMVVALVTVFLDVAVFMLPALAGPPFVTDDPEPVEFQDWEFYVAQQYSHDEDAVFATAPHLEVNYGVIPNMQLHLPTGNSNRGKSDVKRHR